MMDHHERKEDQEAVKFANFMVGLHSCVASSAGVERWFSTIGFVWSSARNRLGHKKAEKLAAIYRTMRKTSKSKDPKAVRAFLAGISLPESMVMAKAITSSGRSEGCGTEGDVVFEDLVFFI